MDPSNVIELKTLKSLIKTLELKEASPCTVKCSLKLTSPLIVKFSITYVLSSTDVIVPIAVKLPFTVKSLLIIALLETYNVVNEASPCTFSPWPIETSPWTDKVSDIDTSNVKELAVELPLPLSPLDTPPIIADAGIDSAAILLGFHDISPWK